MSTKLSRPLGAALALLVAVPAVAGCGGGANAAVDCGKMSISILGDVQDLEDSATNVGQLTDQSRRHNTAEALRKIGDDAKKLQADSDRPEVKKAVDKLSTAVRNAQDSTSAGRRPDLAAIATAAGDVGKVCGSR